MVASRTCRAGLSLSLLMLVAACATPGDRGYYTPDGVPVKRVIGNYVERSEAMQLTVRCQGAYENRVQGEKLLTIHVQLLAASQQSGTLILDRDHLKVDLRRSDGQGGSRLIRTLEPAEVWARQDLVQGDLKVDGFSRLAFDIFFDTMEGLDEPIPDLVLLHWRGRVGAMAADSQCLFERIDSTDPLVPSDTPVADREFGVRDGYYMPGRLLLGERRLIPSDEQRLHYVFHRAKRPWTLWIL